MTSDAGGGRCTECGAPHHEHRYLGEYQMHPGLADTWDEHVRLTNSMTIKQAMVAWALRRAELVRTGVIPDDKAGGV